MKCMCIILQSKLLLIKNKTNNNKHVICQSHSMQSPKEVKSSPKQPSCKKKCAAPKDAVLKKDVKSRW